MQAERENLFKSLKYVDFDVAGNSLRAFYDADDKLVCVLDFFESDTKPNVLLVINPIGNRKWDDILMNDYGVDLETVRPKKDNKYQKLDIDYSGLAEYDDLLQAYLLNEPLDKQLKKLMDFRNVVAAHVAKERFNDAEVTAEKARETIDKANEKIKELQVKLKKLRTKLNDLRLNVGKEPTKESAAKILRAEAQIDSVMEKINRAKKRRGNAVKRLEIAQDEIEAANEILVKLDNLGVDIDMALSKPEYASLHEMTPEEFNPVIVDDADVKDLEQKVNIMAEDDVKPLFDKDPKILNDEIAFKPVVFSEENIIEDSSYMRSDSGKKSWDEDAKNSVPEINDDDDNDVFETPDVLSESEKEDYSVGGVMPAINVQPVQSSVPEFNDDDDNDVFETPAVFSESDEKIDSELLGGFTPLDIPQVPIAEEPQNYFENKQEEFLAPKSEYTPIMPQPIMSEELEKTIEEDETNETIADMPVAPISSDYRPMSPISSKLESESAVVAAPVDADVTVAHNKPNLVYYVMLVVLILLSIFTLWFYQKSMGDSTPELAAKTQLVEQQNIENETVEENQESVAVVPETIQTEPEEVEPIVDAVEEKPVVGVLQADVVFDDKVELDAVSVVEAEPIVLVQEPEPVVVETVEEEPLEESQEEEKKSPFLSDQEVKLIQTEEDVLKNKPVYGVAAESVVYVEPVKQEEKIVVQEVQTPVVEQKKSIVKQEVPVVEYQEPVVQKITSEVFEENIFDDSVADVSDVKENYTDDYYEEAPLQQTASEMIVETEVESTCFDGSAPDYNGCCSGEESVLIDGEYMCCVIGGDECFAPMN